MLLPVAEAERRGSLALALACVGALAAASSPALAQDDDGCEPIDARGPIEVMPAAGAVGVRLDAPVRVLFTEEYFASPTAPLPEESLEITLEGTPVPGVVQLAGDDTLFFRPTGGWEPDTSYEGIAFGDDTLIFSFRTGFSEDARPPTIAPIASVGSVPIGSTCAAPEGGYRIDLTVPVSTDDGAAGSIEYDLYLARAEGLDAPRRVVRVRNFIADPNAFVSMSFALPRHEASGAVCVQLMVTDGVGKLVKGEPLCFDPVEGAHFQSLCSTTPGRGAADRAPWVALVFVLVALSARRRGSGDATRP